MMSHGGRHSTIDTLLAVRHSPSAGWHFLISYTGVGRGTW
jgi:hypothetical protein